MKLFLTIIILLSTNIGLMAQLKECDFNTLTYEINAHPPKDTLADLILSSNAFQYLWHKNHILYTNMSVFNLQYTIEGADICYHNNDTTLVITPHASSWRFSYQKDGSHFQKEYEVAKLPKPDLLLLFDNKSQSRNQELINYKYIDSLSFELAHPLYKFLPEENFRFTITTLTISLLRNRRPIATLQPQHNKTVCIKKIMRKGRPGDRLIVECYPQWDMEDEILRYIACWRGVFFELGSRK